MPATTDQPENLARAATRPHSTTFLPLLVLTLSLLCTYFLWQNERENAVQYLQAEFNARVDDTEDKIEQRMLAYMQIMRAVQGLFAASQSVERDEFHDFISTLRLHLNYPGIQGIAYAQRIPQAELEKHVASMRKQGLPDYRITPDGKREQISSVIYIEPYSGTNLRAIGFDMLSEAARRAAMEQARDSGTTSISGKVTLIQETGEQQQAGILMYLPVYKNGLPHDSLAERRANLSGWIGAPFRMDDLMRGILGQHTDLALQLFDGANIAGNQFLRGAEPGSRSIQTSPLFHATRQIGIIDHAWTMDIRSLPLFEARLDKQKAQFILIAGVGTSLLLAQLAWMLLHGRARALQAAHEMNQVNLRLQDAEQRWRFALEGAGDGVWDADLASNQIYLSTRCKEMLGYADHEIDTSITGWLGRVHPDDLGAFMHEIQKAIDGLSRAFSSEHRRLCKDGTWKWIDVRGMLISQAGDTPSQRMIGTYTDISRRKHAEEALKESEERFRLMIDSIPQLAWMADADGHIFWYNQRWHDYTGATPQQMQGQGWHTVYAPVSLKQMLARWQDAIIEAEPFEMEASLRAGDGSLRRFLTRAQPIKNAEGEVTRWIGTHTDVDALKRAEDQVRELNTSLEQRVLERTAQLDISNSELRAFSYSVSHDLRAPLRGIDGWSQALLEEYSDRLDDEGRQYLHRVRSETQRMGHLIDDLLHLSRVTQSAMHTGMVDLSAMAAETVQRLRDADPARQVQCQIEAGIMAPGDRGLLQIVLNNLLENAWKFTAREAAARIEFGQIEQQGVPVYFVRDNGAGFNMAAAQKLFSPFHRMHVQSEFPGSGIGLATVQRIVRRHGGRIWAESQTGQGACFYFTLSEASLEAA